MRIKRGCFRGIAERIYLESNNICFGPCPAPDEEVEQHLELAASGVGKLRRYTMGDTDEKPMREMALLVGEERARKILGAVGEYFSDYEPSFTTDVGVWTLTITNTDGEEFHFDGSLCGSSPLSDFIRAELGMDDLFLFDGSPDRIEHLELLYQRRIRDASSSSQSEEGYWYYLEKLSIDRAEGSLEYTQGVGGKSSASMIFMAINHFILNRIRTDCFEGSPAQKVLDSSIKQNCKAFILLKNTIPRKHYSESPS